MQYSQFYVHTEHTPAQAYAHVAAAMDRNDKLNVVTAYGILLSEEQDVVNAINSVWFKATPLPMTARPST